MNGLFCVEWSKLWRRICGCSEAFNQNLSKHTVWAKPSGGKPLCLSRRSVGLLWMWSAYAVLDCKRRLSRLCASDSVGHGVNAGDGWRPPTSWHSSENADNHQLDGTPSV